MITSKIKSKMFEEEGQAICKLSETIDFDQLNKLLNLLSNTSHNNVFMTGCGTSAMAAKKAVHTLSVIGMNVFYLNPSDAVHGGLGVVHSKDIIIIISKGGNTAELLSFLPNLKSKHAKIVAITEDKQSAIAKSADLALKVKVNKELDKFNMLATTSTLAVISLFDIIAVSLMSEERFSSRQFLANHPSGAVGKRLKEEVK